MLIYALSNTIARKNLRRKTWDWIANKDFISKFLVKNFRKNNLSAVLLMMWGTENLKAGNTSHLSNLEMDVLCFPYLEARE
jgi:hypothetical protein